MAERHCVIIGNGPAANEAALTLREKDTDLRITMIGKERVGCYRTHLLPNYIIGKTREEDLYVHPTDFYADKNIKLRLGQPVKSVDFSKHEIVLDHKEIVKYHGLIIATGGKPRIPEPFLVFSDIFLTLKTVADANAWIKKLKQIDSVLLVGGDLTSFVFADALIKMGKTVHFVLNDESFWPIRCTPEIFNQATGALSAAGVQVVPCQRLKRLAVQSENSVHVETDSVSLTVGAVGAFFGLRPDVSFLARSGLTIEAGIIVDEHLKTDFDNVYAAGDCAQVFHPELKDYWVSIGYSNAKNLGRIAALNLLGGTFEAEMAPTKIFQMDGIKFNTSWWTEF